VKLNAKVQDDAAKKMFLDRKHICQSINVPISSNSGILKSALIIFAEITFLIGGTFL